MVVVPFRPTKGTLLRNPWQVSQGQTLKPSAELGLKCCPFNPCYTRDYKPRCGGKLQKLRKLRATWMFNLQQVDSHATFANSCPQRG